jgi:hypothetical protein
MIGVPEAFCVCDSPYCYHNDLKTGEVLPCLHIVTGRFYVLGQGEFCRECATNYGIMYGNEQVVSPHKPNTVLEFIESPQLVEGALEQDYLTALASTEPEFIEEDE